MVKHLVMWRLRDSERGAVEPEFERSVLAAIRAMKAGIAGLRTAELGVNRCRAGDAADLALYTEFESWSALEAYEFHPLHEELKRLIGPIRIERRVVDYEVA
jgi:Stress responsive A/B Barrel Domain